MKKITYHILLKKRHNYFHEGGFKYSYVGLIFFHLYIMVDVDSYIFMMWNCSDSENSFQNWRCKIFYPYKKVSCWRDVINTWFDHK